MSSSMAGVTGERPVPSRSALRRCNVCCTEPWLSCRGSSAAITLHLLLEGADRRIERGQLTFSCITPVAEHSQLALLMAAAAASPMLHDRKGRGMYDDFNL